MNATHDTTTTEATTIDISTMQELELRKLLEAATIVIELGLADLTNCADSIVAGTVSYLQDDLMSPAAQTLMKAASSLLIGDKGTQDRLAYVLYLGCAYRIP